MVILRCQLRTVLLMALIMGFSGFPYGVVLAGLNDGLVAYYPFNGNANDESGNGNHGTVHGAILSEDRFGIQNGAYSFNGVDDYIEVADSHILDIQNNLSFSAWIYVYNSTADHQIVLAKWYNNGSFAEMYVFELQPDGKIIQMVLKGISSSGISEAESRVEISFNTWVHIAGTYDSSTVKLYINGEETGSYQTSGIIPATSAPLFIGAHDSRNDRNPFNGVIDDVRIYNRAILEYEIQQLSQGCLPSIDIVLNNNNRVTGDKVVVNAHIKGPGSTDSSCESINVVETIWAQLPDGFVIPLIEPFTALTLLPGDNIETKIFEYTFNGNEPLGSYEIGGSFLHPLNGKNISTDIEILTFSK